jgi:signal transduction histidine kinase
MDSIGRLAGGIAHDFNNLLMGIQGSASLLLSDIDDSHPHYERLNNIEKYAKRDQSIDKNAAFQWIQHQWQGPGDSKRRLQWIYSEAL